MKLINQCDLEFLVRLQRESYTYPRGNGALRTYVTNGNDLNDSSYCVDWKLEQLGLIEINSLVRVSLCGEFDGARMVSLTKAGEFAAELANRLFASQGVKLEND